MKVGDRFKNASGHVVYVVAVKRGSPGSDWYACTVKDPLTTHELTRVELGDLVASGTWTPVTDPPPARTPGEGRCTVCGLQNKYQDGPYTCYVHQN